MPRPSKEHLLLSLFFNEPSRHWHFAEIVELTGLSEPRVAHWLKKLQREGLIERFKPRKKMPYFRSCYEKPGYRHKKKVYALRLMEESGLLARLDTLNAKAVVIFGSFSRSDWYTGSDIDIFVYGDPGEFESGGVWSPLGRPLDVHACRSREEFRQIRSGIMSNVIKGYFVKGSVHDILEAIS